MLKYYKSLIDYISIKVHLLFRMVVKISRFTAVLNFNKVLYLWLWTKGHMH